jgi:hypothetical protein
MQYGDKPVAWTVSIPTSQELMNAFLHKEITEKEMFNQTEQGNLDAVYISAAFTLPEYRGKGIAKSLLIDQTQAFINLNPDMEFFAWVWSPEGGKLIKSLPEDIVGKVKVRE